MKKTFISTLYLALALAGSMWAQQKAQIRIKKNINGVESQETREVIIDEKNSLEDVLRELNSRPENNEGVLDQQIEINIISEGDASQLKRGNPLPRMPFFQSNMNAQRKPTLGVMLKETACNKPKCASERQVLITEVMANSAAAKAGLQAGDVILSINKEEITASKQVIDQVHQLTEGGILKITVERGNKKKKLKAEIESAPSFYSNEQQFNLLFGPDSITMFNLPFGDSLKIMQPFNLSEQGFLGSETAFLGVTPSDKSSTAGVSIKVEPNSPAESMGLLDDDVILEFNGEVIGDFSSLASNVRKCKPESPAELLILRDGKEKRITGSLGKRKQTAADDFQILHDFKGMDDEGNYFYDFEFNMDAEDLQKQMEELFRNFGGNPSIEGFRSPGAEKSSSLLRLEDATSESLKSLSLENNSLSFEQLSLIPQVASGSIDVEFSVAVNSSATVQLKDGEGHTLLYDEKQLPNGNYRRTLDLAPYPLGNYFIIIEQEGKTFVKQIVKYKS
ncbi:MAG: PDZ domain-containing protein [Flavobacteriales bacterium]